MKYTGMKPSLVKNILDEEGIKDIRITCLINDKQNNCDNELVLCVKRYDTYAEIITSMFCDIRS